MKTIYLSLFLATAFFTMVQAQIQVTDLRIENLTNPSGISEAKPRFSWKLNSAKRNTMQMAYEIKVTNALKKTVWSSDRVQSDQSTWVSYGGSDLQPGTKYTWQVRVWDNYGKVSDWSTPAYWQTALSNASGWKAKWIKVGFAEDSIERPSPLFRKTFSASKKISTATAYITSQGLYEAFINGKRVGDSYFTPGWTSYNKRIQYQQYDVTGLLAIGQNAIGVALGSGWYRGYIGFSNQRNFYGKELALLFQLDIQYTDGTSEQIVSDLSWKCATGSILYSEIYHGETIDARKEKENWNINNFNDGNWLPVKLKEPNPVNLISTYNEPIRRHETIKPVKIFKTPKGEQVIDFGQNLVGWVQVKARGKSGDKITIYHAEVLDKAGNFYTENLRPAKQQNNFILKGGMEETFEPHFTFQGFRYIRIEGYPGEIKPENFIAIALYSDMQPSGSFTTSNILINQLQHNIQWGQRGNFLDVPTDCPQRDERLGWTGDAQAFSRTASFNFDVHNFFSKWLKDVALDQIEGAVPFVVPNVLGPKATGSTGWADAATIVPWNMYLAYGDKRILEDQYESMKAWVGFMERGSTNYLWNKGFHFGDWLFYRPFDDNDGRSAVTDKYLIAQCFFAHSVELVVKTAKVLGKPEDAVRYTELLNKIKEAFIREYMTPNGRLVSGTQTAYVLTLNFNLLPENLRIQAAEKLVENVKSYNHLTTGFIGSSYLCHVLSRFGYSDLAYNLLLREKYPSWLYPVKMGATTIWERWDGIKPDSTFQTPSMNSFNHYAYGAIGDWMYRVIAGIDTEESSPGYKSIVIKPVTGSGLTSAEAELNTLYGTIKSSWKKEGEKFTFEVRIPNNTKAKVFVPATSAEKIMETGKPLTAVSEIKVIGQADGYQQLELGSGTYVFTVAN